jgi:uncharacterized protein (DUF4415 family)
MNERLAYWYTPKYHDTRSSDPPEIGDDFSKTARLVMSAGGGKQAVSRRGDEDVVAWFRAQGKGHLRRMNAVLRANMLAQKGDQSIRKSTLASNQRLKTAPPPPRASAI